VRNLRDLAAFTKVHLAPGQSVAVEIPVRLCDLARCGGGSLALEPLIEPC
jgi:hypothetical protein